MSEARFAGTMPVPERQRFDVGALGAWLRQYLDAPPGQIEIEQFRGGQSNPTFLLRLDTRRYVLRKKPNGPLLPSAHAIDREYRVMTALGLAGFPVPRMRVMCGDPGVIGTPFFVMDFVDGRSFWDPSLPGVAPGERVAIYDEMNRVIAALHSIDPAAVGLADYGRSGNYLLRQIDRWTRQYRASQTNDVPEMERLIEWLPAHAPRDDTAAIVHGDFRIDNLIFHPSEPRILAVLDWELSTLGSPRADFAYHLLAWRMPKEELGGLRGFDLHALGIPVESDYLQAYCQRMGHQGAHPREWEFCIVLNLFRIACIRQGILKRVLEGTAASAHAREVGERARITVEMAWKIIQERLIAPD
jgi:aminoglycoside phosphotransferase (APT) family kinase protein